MSTIFQTVVGNTNPSNQLTLDRDGTVIDLTSATSVILIITKELTGTVTNSGNQTCTISGTPTTGIVTYAPASTDFPTAGRYIGDVKITYANSKTEIINEVVIFVARDHG